MSILTPAALHTLVHAFIHSRLDYCNSLLYGFSNYQLQRLQSVQNVAARLITSTNRYAHITPVLRQLHWLPVRLRITYKLAMMVFRCLHGLAPAYLADDCTVATGRRSTLRSGDARTLVIPRTRTTFGDRSFLVAGPSIWNDLPASLRINDLSLDTFSKKLKTHLFSQ